MECNCAIHFSEMAEYLWRSFALVSAKKWALHDTFHFEYDQVSALPSLPRDDPWPGPCISFPCRKTPCLPPSENYGIRKSSHVLLPGTLLLGACTGHGSSCPDRL